MATPPPNPLRPSPLSFNREGRASPFRRPNSPLVSSPRGNSTGPNSGAAGNNSPSTSPLKQSNTTPTTSPLKQTNTTPTAATSPLKPTTPTTQDRDRAVSPLRTSTNAVQFAERKGSFSSIAERKGSLSLAAGQGVGGGVGAGNTEQPTTPSWLNTRGTVAMGSYGDPPASPTLGFAGLRPTTNSPLRASTSTGQMKEAMKETITPAPLGAAGSAGGFGKLQNSSSSTSLNRLSFGGNREGNGGGIGGLQSSSFNDAPAPTAAPTTKTTTGPRPTSNLTRNASSDPTSHIPPQLLHSLRESFAVLDTGNNGTINSTDLANTLSSLGIACSASELASFFPPGQSSSLSLAAYLQELSALIAPLSSTQELLNAFSAFDDDDSGQVDVAELTDALLHVAPEKGERRLTEGEIEAVVEGYRGRRAFGKRSMGGGLGARKNGDVFRYREFVEGIVGGKGGNE